MSADPLTIAALRRQTARRHPAWFDGEGRRRDWLAKHQRALILLLADGHSIESAAANLEISHQTAKNYLRDARERSGCQTSYELIARVVREDMERKQ